MFAKGYAKLSEDGRSSCLVLGSSTLCYCANLGTPLVRAGTRLGLGDDLPVRADFEEAPDRCGSVCAPTLAREFDG